MKEKNNRDLSVKMVVSSISKYSEKVNIMVADNAETESLFIVIAGKIMPDSVVYMDNLCSCDMSDIGRSPPITG